MNAAKHYLNTLNADYLAVHRRKEDLFWTTYMGTSDDHKGSAEAESSWVAFISNTDRLTEIRAQLDGMTEGDDAATKVGLQGWLALFEANVLETEAAKSLKAELIKAEGELFEARQAYTMTYVDQMGETQEGSSPVLSANIGSNENESVRESSHQALLDLEQWVLNNGFIELVKLRNQFAKAQGYRTFFDYSVQKTEQMSTEELFVILDDFEQRTRDGNLDSIQALREKHGESALKAHNFRFTWGGDSTRELDPYVPFSKSLRQWVDSFSRLNIDYSEAVLTLDLLDRKGKYANGFCHAPVPAFYDQSQWVPAVVNFTSLAKPSQVGSGYDGLGTLFHEGGHAAHFANVKMNAPCFSQEFAPSSMAFAETQSMFLDSLITDGDWLKLYAKDKDGNVIPDSIIEKGISERQPFRSYGERGILVVPYFERALYELEEDQLNAESITCLARAMELKILGLKTATRPLLSIPHLLSDESACSYQGYLMANMAVYQTRAYFIERFGYLTDNPEIGPLLSEHYWRPGNSISHDASIRALTGEGFNAKFLADECNLSTTQAWEREQRKIAQAKTRVVPATQKLNASIRVVDGDKVLASNEVSNETMCEEFERYVEET